MSYNWTKTVAANEIGRNRLRFETNVEHKHFSRWLLSFQITAWSPQTLPSCIIKHI